MVLIPGLGGDGAFWNGVASLLQGRYRLIVTDHRGAGQSDRPDGPYSIPRIAKDVLGILDDLGIQRATFVGHSTGGMIVQTIATSCPRRASAIILSGTWERRDLRFRRMFQARIALLKHAGAVDYHRLTQALGYDNDWLEAHAEEMAQELDRAEERLAPKAVQLARMQMLLEHDCHERLPEIDCPTLVLGAGDDALIPLVHAERLAALIPNARLRALSGGHFYPRAYPEQFATHVSSFIEEAFPCTTQA